MATKAELRDQVLEYIGKKRIGQSVTNELQVDIEQAIDEVYADLQSDKLATWSSTGAIPNDVLPHVKALVAFRRSSGLSMERKQVIMNDANIAKREIRRIIAPNHEPIEEPTDF